VLATARIGAVHEVVAGTALAGALAEPVKVLVTASSEAPVADALGQAAQVPAVVLVKQRDESPWDLVEGRDYDWDVVLRAGRTDPAAWLDGAHVTPYDDLAAAWVGPLLDGGTLTLP
jgi:propionyl-CoA synthetase